MVGESENMPPDGAASRRCDVADANRDVIVGIKVRVGRGTPRAIQGAAPLDIALQVANEVGMPLMCAYRPSAAELRRRWWQCCGRATC